MKRASVNCFGIAGANSHAILESSGSFMGPMKVNGYRAQESSRPNLLVLSAASQKSISKSIVEHQKYLQQHPSRVQDVVHTLCQRREHLQFRSFAIKTEESMDFTPSRKQNTLKSITMIFTGQGAQWAGMASSLLRDYPSFEQDIEIMSSFLSALADPPSWNLKDELLKPEKDSNLSRAEYAQPTSTAVQVALVNLLSNWGICPSAVIGHSSGEIAAAYAANAITVREAIIIAYYRGKAASTIPKGGSMTAIGLGREAVLPLLEPDVVVACENSPNSVVISGNEASLLTSCERIQKAQMSTTTRSLNVGVAYHSRESAKTPAFSNFC